MSSLVIDLQADAINPSVSVLTLLRKALVVASKLNIEEFQKWIELESNGYNDEQLPEYRKTKGQIRGWNPYHGWNPIITYDQTLLEIYASLCNCSISQSMSELVALTETADNELQIQLPHQIESYLTSTVHTKVKVSISPASVRKIVESVRDIILNWALKLEKDGITGVGISFSSQEKQIAANQDYSHLIQINIGQSQMQNSSSESQSNLESFKNDLRGANIGNLANLIKDNARQVACDFSQNIGQNTDEIVKLIFTLREMAENFPQTQREEVMVHLDDLQEDITIAKKLKPQRIKTRIVALLAIATTIAGVVAGATDFSNNVLELAEKLGISIEMIQPQRIQQVPPSSHSRSSNP